MSKIRVAVQAKSVTKAGCIAVLISCAPKDFLGSATHAFYRVILAKRRYRNCALFIRLFRGFLSDIEIFTHRGLCVARPNVACTPPVLAPHL